MAPTKSQPTWRWVVAALLWGFALGFVVSRSLSSGGDIDDGERLCASAGQVAELRHALKTCDELHRVAGAKSVRYAGGSGSEQNAAADSASSSSSPSTEGAVTGVSTSTIAVTAPDGSDAGYIPGILPGVMWWYNTSLPQGAQIFNLDLLYPESYHAKDHVKPYVVRNYATATLAYCRLLRGRDCGSVAEFGTARCYFSQQFLQRELEFQGVEGARSALANCLARGVPTEVLRRHDLRLPINLGRRYDLALNTEVAEHIEPPFSSQLVYSLVQHSDIVWFSAETPLTANTNHIHHPNEPDIVIWQNIFAFYGYSWISIPDDVALAVGWRGGYIFFKPSADVKLPPGYEAGSEVPWPSWAPALEQP